MRRMSNGDGYAGSVMWDKGIGQTILSWYDVIW